MPTCPEHMEARTQALPVFSDNHRAGVTPHAPFPTSRGTGNTDSLGTKEPKTWGSNPNPLPTPHMPDSAPRGSADVCLLPTAPAAQVPMAWHRVGSQGKNDRNKHSLIGYSLCTHLLGTHCDVSFRQHHPKGGGTLSLGHGMHKARM